MKLQLASPRGFCAGVDRAIEIVNRALDLFGAPVYVRHEVVHNKAVVDDLRRRGAVFIDEVADAPDDAILIFSAHGVSKQVREEADKRQVRLFDATCPLVTKVHLEVARYSKQGIHCILIGHRGHPEVDGTLGQYDCRYGGRIYLVETIADIQSVADDIKKQPHQQVAYVTQTTLSMDDTRAIIEQLKTVFPDIRGPKKNDICYATQNRQDAVKQLAKTADLVLVVGSRNSSNSNRLREVALKTGIQAYLIDNADEIQDQWLQGVNTIGLTAGASAPEYLVAEVKAYLVNRGVSEIIDPQSEKEAVFFPLPKALQQGTQGDGL